MPIEQEFYLPIYRILVSKIAEQNKIEKVSTWLLENHKNIKLSTLRSSFRKAGRDDLCNYYIDEIDVKVGDKVKSRSTGRLGKVKEIKADGETLVVKWNEGGHQMLSKDHIMIMHTDEPNHFDRKDFSNAKTALPGYNKHDKKDTDITPNSEVKVIDFNDL